VKLAEMEAKCAVSLADYVNAWGLQWSVWLSRGRAARELGQKAIALKSYFRAISYAKGIWWVVYSATEAGAVSFKEEVQAAYREYVDLLMEKGDSKQAYKLANEAKARVMLNLIATRLASTPRDSEQEATLREREHSIARLRSQLVASDLTREQEAKLQKEIDDLELQALSEISRYKERLVWSEPATVDQLQKQTAREGVALAEFCLGEDRSFVWLFTRGEFFFETLPSRKEIENAVRAYLATLAAAPDPLHLERDLTKVRTRAEALFTMLFGSLTRQIKPGERLIVVPDGLLHYLPFEALMRDGRYLVEDHEISYNPSASMLGLWQESGSKVDGGDKLELFAVGDPVFVPRASAPDGKRSRYGSLNGARQEAAANGLRLAPLPWTRDEVQHIAGLFPADRRRVLLGTKSTEAAIKREPLRRYRHLHFATHSFIDEKYPWRSAIVLSFDGDAEEDGSLNVSEIARLNLDCDLVVVSACQTGRGKLLSGEGIIGLSRAFLQAGARAVVVSLWNVSDISTGRLMKSFYQHLTGGLSNAAALRRAKQQMLGSGEAPRHPYYWSSFVMLGKP
jgi:CHAT domain-containing protein